MKEYFTKSSSLAKDFLKKMEKVEQQSFEQTGGSSISHPEYIAYKSYKKYKQKYRINSY